MKRLLVLAAIICWCQCSWAVHLGTVSVADNAVFPLTTVDTLGRWATPDSFCVVLNHEDAADNTVDYQASGNTTVGWVMLNVWGETDSDSLYWFRDAIADIDNGQGNGLYTGVVWSYCQGEPFPTYFSFYLADTNMQGYLNKENVHMDRDTIIADLSTLYNVNVKQWKSQAVTVTGTYPDVNVFAVNGNNTVAQNLEEALDDDGNGAPNLELRQVHIVAAGARDTALVIVGGQSGAGGKGDGPGVYVEGGDSANGFVIKGGSVIGSGLVISSTSGDAMNVTATSGDAVEMTSLAGGNGLYVESDGSGYAALAVYSALGNGIESQADGGDGLNLIGSNDGMQAVGVSKDINADISGNLSGSVTGSVNSVTTQVNADVQAIDGDATAATNLEKSFDGDTATVPVGQLTLEGIHIFTGGAAHPGIYVNSTNGNGATITGSGQGFAVTGSNGPGLSISGSTNGVSLSGNAGAGLLASGSTYGVQGTGSTAGLGFIGIGAGNGAYISGGTSSGSKGLWIASGGANGAAVDIDGGASSGIGIDVDGGGSDADIEADISGTITTATNVTTISNGGIDAPAFASDAQYMVYGGGVWVDTCNVTGNAATGTTVGVNGIPTAPSISLSDAKTIADAIGVRKFFMYGDQGSGTDTTYFINETMTDYHFVGIGDHIQAEVDLNSANVDGCYFENMHITGIQGGSKRIELVDCALEGPTIYALARHCSLRGNVTLNGKRDNIFDQCYSAVPGNNTPSLIFSGGSESVNFRHYSGGLELDGIGANDSISYESDGQLIINANANAAARVTVRGMCTITDNKGLTNLTYNATSQFFRDSLIDKMMDSTLEALDYTNNTNHILRVADTNNAWSAVGGGSGLKTVVAYVIDTSGTDDTLSQAVVGILNSGQTQLIASGTTTGSPAKVTLTMDSTTSYVAITNPPGYVFDAYSFTTTDGVTPDTIAIQGYNASTTSVPSSHQTTLTGTCRLPDGTALVGCEVTITLAGATAMYSSTNTYPPGLIQVYSDGSGDWSATIIGTDSLSAYMPAGTPTYCVTYRHPSLQPTGTMQACGLSIAANGSTTALRDVLAQ